MGIRYSKEKFIFVCRKYLLRTKIDIENKNSVPKNTWIELKRDILLDSLCIPNLIIHVSYYHIASWKSKLSE